MKFIGPYTLLLPGEGWNTCTDRYFTTFEIYFNLRTGIMDSWRPSKIIKWDIQSAIVRLMRHQSNLYLIFASLVNWISEIIQILPSLSLASSACCIAICLYSTSA